MWKAVSRSICEAVERRGGFTVFRYDASKSNSPDVQETCRSPPKENSCVQRWMSCCPSKGSKAEDGKTSSGTQDEQSQENKQHEDQWNRPHINPQWFGAMGWSTALVLGWYLCQPFGWCHFFRGAHGRQHLCKRRERRVQWNFSNSFPFNVQPSVKPLQLFPINATYDIVEGSPSFGSSTSNSADTGVGLDILEDENLEINSMSSVSSSADTGVSIGMDDSFVQRSGPFTPEEALDEVSRVFEAASQTFSGDVENKLGMVCMKKEEHAEALRHFRRASHHDNANAAYNIGQCYELGLGTVKNMKKAAKWYKIASDRGHSVAMFNLAVFFAHGLGGLSEDKDQAFQLLTSASNLGLKQAKEALAFIIAESRPPDKKTNLSEESQTTDALLEMLGVRNDKLDDMTRKGFADYSKVVANTTQFSHSDCMDLSLTYANNEVQHQREERLHLYNDLCLRRGWGLKRLCIKIPVGHDTVVV